MSDTRDVARLPVEILAHILADVDFDDLKTCSLVSRAFLLATRPYIFERATIDLHPYSTSSGSAQNHPSTKFLQFLACDEENYAGSFISTLCFVDKLSSSPLPVEHLESHWSEVAEQLAKLLPKLTRLHHLVIKSSFLSDWTLVHNGMRQVLFQFMQVHTVHHVELHHIGLSRGELLALTWIRKVTLVGVYEAYKQTSNTTIHPAQHMVSLLRNLSITLKSPEGARYMFQLANAAKKSLSSLRWLTSSYIGM